MQFLKSVLFSKNRKVRGFEFVPDDECIGCGMRLEKRYMCGRCFEKVDEDTKRCPNCGSRFWVVTDWI